MKIDALFSGALSVSEVNTANPVAGGEFSALLKQAETRAASKPAASSEVDFAASDKAVREQKKAEATRAAHAAVAGELHDYLKKTPAQHLRDAVLKELGLTEEALQAMPPKEREAVEAKINQRIKERLAGKQDGPQDDWHSPVPSLAGAIRLTSAQAITLLDKA